ncbi:MAG: PIG-L family deacetylase [Bryobacterales bacterium]|nr:PIG-L family deacetylase [Bryobacterales bacterium]
MAVFAHPDEETIVGALSARYAGEGHRVHVLAIANGDRGKTPNTTLEVGPELGAARIPHSPAICLLIADRRSLSAYLPVPDAVTGHPDEPNLSAPSARETDIFQSVP